jgi:hypothetical protein
MPKVKMPEEIYWFTTQKDDFKLLLPNITLSDDKYLIGYRAPVSDLTKYKNRIYIFINFENTKNINTGIYEYCKNDYPISIWLYFDKMPDSSFKLTSFLTLYDYRLPSFQQLYSRVFKN